MNAPAAEESAPTRALREATAESHRRVEQLADWDAIFGSREGYTHFLSRLHTVISAAESGVDELLLGAGSWVADRRRAAWIAEDLAFLGLEPKVLTAPQIEFGWVKSVPEAAGVAYVLEGSALGGVHLARRARQSLGIDQRGVRYLAGNREATGSHWLRVKLWLDQVLSSPGARQQAIDAAERTFEIYSWAVKVRC